MRVFARITQIILGLVWANIASAGPRCTNAYNLPIERNGSDIIVPGRVNGKPVRFGVDLGAADTQLIKPIMDDLKLRPTGKAVNEHTFGDTKQEGYLLANTLEVLGQTFKNESFIDAGNIDRTQDPRNPREGGLLGAILLSRFDILIDVPHDRISFYKLPNRCPPGDILRGRYVVLKMFPSDEQKRPLFYMSVAGRSLLTVLDTGAYTSKMQRSAAEKTGVDAAALTLDQKVTGYGNYGKDTTRIRHRFASVKIGSLPTESRNFDVTSWTTSEKVEATLSMDYVEKRPVFISYSRRRLYVYAKE